MNPDGGCPAAFVGTCTGKAPPGARESPLQQELGDLGWIAFGERELVNAGGLMFHGASLARIR